MGNTADCRRFVCFRPVPMPGTRARSKGTAAGLDLPGPAAEDGDLVAFPSGAGDIDVVAADHEVDVDGAPIDLVHVLRAYRDLVGVAERDVARGVLVEERVVEGRAELPDAAFAVDEGDLAEPRGVGIVGCALAEHVAASPGLDVHCAAALEPDLEAVDDRACDVARLRRAHGAPCA